ncbi:MAG: tRNA (adenosine(37)-N6)-threonylcarbamoyltransferase complex dimerization subunit type 1 TsaB [Kiritimatiellia bacterium]
MNLLAIDRSTDTQSVALALDGTVVSRVFAGLDSRSAEWPVKIRAFVAANGLALPEIDQILVGQGPGSFAGIRAALAFAQGLALPGGKPVVGLPSAMALTRSGTKIAVVGDARRERYWVVLYEGVRTVRDFTLATRETLGQSVPEGYTVVTPDGARIEPLLKAVFAGSYAGALVPLAGRLAEIAVSNPGLMRPDPLPVYLSPAVR